MNNRSFWQLPYAQTLATALRSWAVDRATGHIAVVMAGHVLRLSLGLVSSAILARGLGPEGLSAFSVVGAAMMIAITIGDFGLSNSAVRYIAADLTVRPEEAYRTGRLFVSLKLAGSLAITTAILLLARPIAALLHLPAGTGPLFVRIGALGVLATSFSGIVSTLLQALRRFPALIGSQSLNITLTLVLAAALLLARQLTIPNALFLGVATALAAALFGLWALPAAWQRTLLPTARLAAQDVRRLWGFGKWIGVSTVLAILLAQLDLLLLNRWSTPRETGYYALALNLALKADVVNQTLFIVLLPIASALAGRQQIIAYLGQNFRRNLLLAGLLILTLPLARPFILAVYGSDYGPSAGVFYLLIIITLFDLLTLPLLLLAYPLNMPRWIALSHVVRISCMFVASSLLIPTLGIYGAALAKLIAKVVGALFIGSALLARLRSEVPVMSSSPPGELSGASPHTAQATHQPDEPPLP